VELAFESRTLREICEDDSISRKRLGNEVSQKLIVRLADLRAVSSVQDLPAGYPYDIKGEEVLFEICQGYQLRVVSNHPDNPVTDSGSVDWSRVYRIKIIEIADRHD
jgi:hypothetical protein